MLYTKNWLLMINNIHILTIDYNHIIELLTQHLPNPRQLVQEILLSILLNGYFSSCFLLLVEQ